MAISMLKIRRPLGRLIFNMGIAISGKTVFLIETAPRIAYSNSRPGGWDPFIIADISMNYEKGEVNYTKQGNCVWTRRYDFSV